MKPFKKRRRGGVVATFEPNEAQLLATLASQVIELLRDRSGTVAVDADPLAVQLGMGGPVVPPEDPVLARLLPDAYRDAPDDAAEFRRFTEDALSATKVANAGAIIETLDSAGLAEGGAVEVELHPEQVQAWLRALTDIRLALAVRLGIEDESDHEIVAHSGDEAVAAMAEVYDWLGFVQESLVLALP